MHFFTLEHGACDIIARKALPDGNAQNSRTRRDYNKNRRN